jgi:hypothetical protein
VAQEHQLTEAMFVPQKKKHFFILISTYYQPAKEESPYSGDISGKPFVQNRTQLRQIHKYYR